MEETASDILNWADFSFKYILIAFNFITLIVVYIHKSKQKHKKQHHVLFVTAHPDDQVMFFRPSIVSITKNYFVHLLCLSGKGSQRQQQLIKSAQKLQIYRIESVSNQKLKDSMECQWPKQQIQFIVQKYISKNNIKAIFTFDQFGVSGHLNHRSIGLALKQLHYPQVQLKILNKKESSQTVQERQQVKEIKKNSIKIYHLESVNLIRKYTGILELPFALLKDFCWINLNLINAFRLMVIHKSQFLWYRKLWILWSQYTYINTYSMTRMRINSYDGSNQQKLQQDKSNQSGQEQGRLQENKKPKLNQKGKDD